MTKLLKTLLTLGVGLATVSSTINISYAAAKKAVNPNVPAQATKTSTAVGNHIVATYVGQDNVSNVVLLSDIKPYLPKNTANPSQEQIEKATQAYVVAKLKTMWENRSKASVKVSQQEVEAVLRDEAAKNGLSFEDFKRALAYQGLDINLIRKNIYNSIFQAKSQQFLQQNVEAQLDHDKIQATGYKNYQIDKAAGTLETTESPDLSYIFVQETPVFDSKQAQAKITDIAKQISSNKISFADAAKKYSDDVVSAAQNGKLGNITNLPEKEINVVGQAISKLKPGQIATPVHIPNKGWYLVRFDGTSKVPADINYYINKEYQKEVQAKYKVNSLESFLLNSVVIKYIPTDAK